MNISTRYVTKKGRSKPQNEDAALVDNQIIQMDWATASDEFQCRDRVLLAVADGIGGHSDGASAANTVLSTLLLATKEITDFDEISRKITATGELLGRKSRHYPPGAALAGALLFDKIFHIFWAGDCVMKLFFADGDIFQTTQDSIDVFGRKILTNAIGGGTPNGGTLHLASFSAQSCRVLMFTDGAGETVDVTDADIVINAIANSDVDDDATAILADVIIR